MKQSWKTDTENGESEDYTPNKRALLVAVESSMDNCLPAPDMCGSIVGSKSLQNLKKVIR